MDDNSEKPEDNEEDISEEEENTEEEEESLEDVLIDPEEAAEKIEDDNNESESEEDEEMEVSSFGESVDEMEVEDSEEEMESEVEESEEEEMERDDKSTFEKIKSSAASGFGLGSSDDADESPDTEEEESEEDETTEEVRDEMEEDDEGEDNSFMEDDVDSTEEDTGEQESTEEEGSTEVDRDELGESSGEEEMQSEDEQEEQDDEMEVEDMEEEDSGFLDSLGLSSSDSTEEEQEPNDEEESEDEREADEGEDETDMQEEPVDEEESEENYDCKYEDCDRTFGTERGRAVHMGRSHKDEEEPEQEDTQDSDEEEEESEAETEEDMQDSQEDEVEEEEDSGGFLDSLGLSSSDSGESEEEPEQEDTQDSDEEEEESEETEEDRESAEEGMESEVEDTEEEQEPSEEEVEMESEETEEDRESAEEGMESEVEDTEEEPKEEGKGRLKSGEDDDGSHAEIFRYEDVNLEEALTVLGGVDGGMDGLKSRFRRISDERPILSSIKLDSYVPLSLLVYGIVFWFISVIAGSQGVGSILNNPSRLGDFLLFDVVVITLATAGLFILRKRHDRGKWLRRSTLGLQAVPAVVALVFLVSAVAGGAVFDIAISGVELLTEMVNSVLPLDVYLDASPVGLSPRVMSTVMILWGAILTIPFAVDMVKAGVRAASTDYSDLPSQEEQVERDIEELVNLVGEPGVRVEDDEFADVSPIEMLQLDEGMRSSPYEDYEEIERYWLKAPYSYAKILHSEAQSDYRYHVIEPEIDEGRQELVLDEFMERLRNELLYEDIEEGLDYEEEVEQKIDTLERKVLEIAEEYNISIDNETFHKLLYIIERNQVYYGEIDPLMNDPNIEDISCDGKDVPVFVFHREYKDLMTNVTFELQNLRSFIIQMAQRSGEHISMANPQVDASLPDGSRAQLTLSADITTRGPSFTIRKFQDIPFTPVDLIKAGTFDVEQMAYLWLAIENNKSLIFAGGTASGKTTSMNAVSLFIPPKSKIVSLEDTRELSLPHQNWVPSLTREAFGLSGENSEGIDMYNLLRAALRMRPEYLIVGEIRGEEARTLFQAMSTGHTTYSTMHADSLETAKNRLTNPPINVPESMINVLDIMCIQKQVRMVDDETGEVENERRNDKTIELIQSGGEGQRGKKFDVYRRDASEDSFISYVEDSHVLKTISEEEGWSEERVRQELENRKKVLEYLVDNDITDVRKVTRTVQAFMADSDKILEQIENDNLQPEKFRDVTSVEFHSLTEPKTDEVLSGTERAKEEIPELEEAEDAVEEESLDEEDEESSGDTNE